MTLPSESEYVTQPQWAARCGVSRRTFLNWRAAGIIPEPDVNLPGQLRWTVALVEKTMRGFRRPAIGRPRSFGAKGAAFQRDRLQRGRRP